MRGRRKGWARRLRFFILETLVLPIAVIPLRALVRSWRRRAPDDASVARDLAAPRLVLATYHGMLLHLLAFAPLCARHDRRLVVMLSPSLDGRLLAAALARFGIDHVRATSGSRAVTGSREFLRRVAAGDVGVVAVDGPLGPCCTAKPGFLRLATAARASVLVATTSAGSGLRFGSWDRAHLPLPFAPVELALRLLPPPAAPAGDGELAAIQALMLAEARRMASPVLPRAVRA
jgi:lysophospholipid acyltransferase (LPLAT)-like uncharacterized protein